MKDKQLTINKDKVSIFHTDLVEDNFRWITTDRQALRLSEMKTSHIFNSMKMLYNHRAQRLGLPVFWFNKKYHDLFPTIKKLAESYYLKSGFRFTPEEIVSEIVILFIVEIEKRKDLPSKYKAIYKKIINILISDLNKKRIKDGKE